jgi:hypothetical protein
MLEIKSVVVHFQGKVFNWGGLLEDQLAVVGEGATGKGT